MSGVEEGRPHGTKCPKGETAADRHGRRIRGTERPAQPGRKEKRKGSAGLEEKRREGAAAEEAVPFRTSFPSSQR